MKITRTSMFSEETRTREIDVTPEQPAAWETGTHIQRAAPQLSDEDREFLISGITPEEWNAVFGPEDEEAPPDAP